MREQDLIRRTNRTDELLHQIGWLGSDERLYIIKGSWTDKTPWGVGVETIGEEGVIADHPLLDKLPHSGILGETKREMADALAVANSLLIGFIADKRVLEHGLENRSAIAAQSMRQRAGQLAERVDRDLAMDIWELDLEDSDGSE